MNQVLATNQMLATNQVLATGLAKRFGATHALTRADLDVRPGEVHTVIGENGSGKSTLVKILAGVHRADAGGLMVNGAPADGWRSPADARKAGVATIFQEVLTVPGRSILQNIWLGAPGPRGASTDQARWQRAEEVMQGLLGEPVDVGAPVDSLPLSGRQACCIARALVRDPQVLILDESTSALDIATRDRLFAVLRDLRARGCAIVFISHRMDEVFDITDVVTVLRSGSTVAARLPIAATSVSGLVDLMTGSTEHHLPPLSRPSGAVVLEAVDVVLAPDAPPVDFELRAGELVGLAGLEGQGQEAFLDALRGAGPGAGGTSRLGGPAPVRIDSPFVARGNGIAYVPRERRHEALFEQLSIRENFGLATMSSDTVGGLVRHSRTTSRLAGFGGPLGLRMGSPDDPISTLSGGNQQKVVLARALADRPRVLLLNDPTRGIDLTSKRELYAMFRRLCDEGMAVVMLTSEVDELIELVDRVLIFRGQTLATGIDRSGLTRNAVISAYFGLSEPLVGREAAEALDG